MAFFVSNEYQQAFESINEPSIFTGTECIYAKPESMETLASTAAEESMDTSTQKNDTTVIQSVWNIKRRSTTLHMLKSNIQLSTGVDKEGLRRLSRANQDCTEEMSSPIEREWYDDFKRSDRTNNQPCRSLQRSWNWPITTGIHEEILLRGTRWSKLAGNFQWYFKLCATNRTDSECYTHSSLL